MSIKKKLVTAVTTAGLLAGLFGSAFVPVARAAADDAALVVTCASSDNTGAAASSKQTCTYVSTVTPSVAFVFTPDDTADIGAYTFTASGTTITNVIVEHAASGGTHAMGITSGSSVSVNMLTSVAAKTMTVTLTLAKVTAGSSATITATDDDSTPMTLTVTSIAAAKAGVTATVATSQSTRTLSDDITATGATAINGSTTVNNSVDYMALAYNGGSASAAGNYGVTYAVADVYGTAVNISAKLFTATISPSTCGSAGVGSTLADAVTASGISSNSAVGTSGGADKGCLAAVTVTENLTGTVLHTFSIGFLGETASLVLTGPSALASNLANDTDLEDQITVVAKDSAGIVIPGIFANPTFTVTDDAAADIAETFVDDNATNGGVLDDNIFDLDNAVCASGKEGKTRTIYAEGETLVATGKAKSNTLTITCTGKVAYVSAIAFGKTSYYPTEIATVTFTLKDSAARASGVGSYMDNDGFAISNSPSTGGSGTTEPAEAIADTGIGNGILIKTVGTDTWTYTMGTAAGVAGFLFDITDNDGATDGSQQGQFAVRTVVNAAFASASDATLTAGPKKKIATATFGAAIGKKVAFVLENASGVTKTYYRKANASGVATYTLALNGTWTVYATFGDEITDTVTLKK
jgi:hypothetical protein